MKTDSVSTAFQIILEEIDSVVSDVNSQGAAFLRNGDYPHAETSIAAGKNLAAFRFKLETLNHEWLTGLDEPTRSQVQVPSAKIATSIESAPKAPKSILVVKLQDGSVIFKNTAAETFAQTLKVLGLEKVIQLGAKVNYHHLVSKQKSDHYPQMEIDGYLIMTHSSTESKREKLLEISKALNIPITVDVVPAKGI